MILMLNLEILQEGTPAGVVLVTKEMDSHVKVTGYTREDARVPCLW